MSEGSELEGDPQRSARRRAEPDHRVEGDGQAFAVIYVGTTKGRVLKIVNTADPNGGLAQRPVFIEELILYPASVPVDKLKVVRDEQGGRAKLVVLTKDQVAAVPLARCSLLAKSCGVCIALQDPYCAWSVRDGQCVSLVNSDPDRLDSAAYLQVSSYYMINFICSIPVTMLTTLLVLQTLTLS